MKANLATVVLAALAISACSTTPKATTGETPIQDQAAGNDQVTATAETGTVSAADIESAKLAAQLQEMQKNGIYFDFGEFIIKPEYSGLIRQQAELMKAHGNLIVTLEGNADERGSSEYNLALGDRRANAVRNALKIAGASDSQIVIVSKGEESPRLDCHEERCWKENRRVDLLGKVAR